MTRLRSALFGALALLLEHFDMADVYLATGIALLYVGLAPIYLPAAHVTTAAILLYLALRPHAAAPTDERTT